MIFRPLLLLITIFVICSCNNSKPTAEFTVNSFSISTHDKMGIEFYDMKYVSDGLKIQGYIHKPKKEGKFPVIIYNRGGNRDFGIHNPRNMTFQEEMTNAGYVVLSTQLRGNKFSEGEDEMGGKELNDIIKLIDIAAELDYADENNIGAYGISRGGMNTYQLSRATDKIKCIAIVGGPVDPRIDFETRPEMYSKVYYPLVGDSIEMKLEYDKRSPIKWVNEINEPALILHGMEDWRVTPQNAELMINAMERNGNEFNYKLFEGGNHSLSSHLDERNKMLIDWFDKFLKAN